MPADANVIEANKMLVRSFFDLLESGDIDGAIALFAPGGTFWSPSTRTAMPTADLANALRWVNTKLEAPMTYTLGAMTAEDNRVCVLAESFANMLNGKRYNNVYHFYFEIEDGLIALAREYNDTAHIWATLRAEA
jgi:ketosteroid isomerase-like protein